MKRELICGLVPACLMACPLAAQEDKTSETATHVLPTVVVTGTRTERVLSEVPIRTEVIPIQSDGVAATCKLAEALDLGTGLRIESTCQNCNSSEVQMLGLPQRYAAILTDGLPVFSSLAGIYGIEQIPIEFVDRIEVVKGGGSALYGPSAVAGVINLIPREPDFTGGGVNVRYNLMEGDRSGDRPSLDGTLHGTLASDDGKLGVRLFGINSYVQAVDVNHDDFSEVSRRDLWAGGFRGMWKPVEGMKLTVDYQQSNEDRRGGSDGNQLDRPANTVEIAEAITTRQHVGTIILRHKLSESFDYRLGFSVADVDRDSYYGGTAALGSPDPASPYYDPTWTPDRGFGKTQNRLYVADAQANWKALDAHTLSLSLQWRQETLKDFQPTVNRVRTDDYENFGTVLQIESEWNGKWSTVASARVDLHSELDAPEPSARLAARYSLMDKLRLRGSLGTGFRAPEVFNEDFHITNIGGELANVVNADNLKAEKSLTVTFGPEWEINKHWNVEVNGFHTWLSDTFVVEAADDPATTDVLEFERVNGGRSRVYGGEFNVNFAMKPVRASVGYVEQRLEYADPQLLLGDPTLANPNDNPIYSSRYPRVPDRYGVVRFDCDLQIVELSLAGKLTGPMDVPHVVSDSSGNLVRNELTRSDWFFTVDAAFTRKWKLRGGGRITASIGVQNLFNSHQDDLDKGPYRDSTYVYGPRFPRTLFAGVGCTF